MRRSIFLSSLLSLLSVACGDDASTTGGSGGSTWTTSGGGGSGGAGNSPDGPGGTGGTGGTGGNGGGVTTACIPATGSQTPGSNSWSDDAYEASVTIDDAASCTRTYQLSSTAPLRDNVPDNPRSVLELASQPVVRTGNDMFDALYALAHTESRENSVDSISNFAFNGNQPLPCPTGGCFETGRLWTYVWTRDTSYSVALGLGLLDPTRARNSMEFKTSPRRDGTRMEIVQDTGTGGSWPISTDRVVWALGAWEVLKYLDGAERTAFRDLAFEAMDNTAQRDRNVVFDPADGLYRGEQSFLDWREQTYPGWTKTDTVHIGMSKSLSTNIGHLRMLQIASALATEKGNDEAATEYSQWAAALRTAIREELWLEDAGMFSTYKTTSLDSSPTHRFDLLGEAFAVLYGVADEDEARTIVSSYPHFDKGAPVATPQQQDTPIYHNRAIWPFVTAFWAKAAAKVGNAAAVDHAIVSLMRGAAMNLSNMENFESVSGAAWLDDGATSGPVVNSQRQLWSVAGYLSMVHDVVFGLDANQTGIRFLPKLTGKTRSTLFSGSDSIALSNLSFHGKRVDVVLKLPQVQDGSDLQVASVRLDGEDIGMDFVDFADLKDHSVFEVTLETTASNGEEITLLSSSDVADYQNVFGPRTPSIQSVTAGNGQLTVQWDAAGETAVTFNLYRDGVQIADGLSTTSYTDPTSTDLAVNSHCYTVESVFASGNASQHAKPVCFFGSSNERVQVVGAQSFASNAGTLVFNHGRWHYEDWGDPSDTLTISNIVPTKTGVYLLQVLAGNGAGDTTSGVSCGVKSIAVFNGPTLVGQGQLLMPHLGSWDEWRDSSFVSVNLTAGQSYSIVIREDASSGNMSDLDHFSLYNGTGGTGGRFNKVNISEVKILGL